MGEAESPWLPFKDKIRSVSVEDKITATEDWIEKRILTDRSLTNLKAVDLHKVGVETLAYADSISCDANDSIATISLGSSFSIIRDNGSRWLELRCGYWQSRNNGDFFEHDRMPSKAADTYTFAGTDPKPNCWIHNNTAVWGLFDGQLTVKPAEGLDEGSFGHGYSFSSSWGKLAPQITSAKIEKKVHIDPQGLFSFDTRNVVDLGWFLPKWSESFVTLTVGPNFSFKGYSSDINHVLMPQDSQWKSSTDVKTYNWDAMPSCVAATYSRVQKASESSGFWDVDTSNPHFPSILWLSASGISTGFPDGGFHPMANVVRQDMAAFLYRLCGEPDFTPSSADKLRFTDVTEATPHAKEIWWLASTGISTGYPDGTFRPVAAVVRQDMAAFLHRTYVKFGIGNDKPAGAGFPDVGSNTPHAVDICWLAANGVSTGYPDGTFHPMANVVRQDMAAFLKRIHDLGA